MPTEIEELKVEKPAAGHREMRFTSCLRHICVGAIRPGLGIILMATIISAAVAFGQSATAPPRDNSIDGYWLFRAPVDSAQELSGESMARRNGPVVGNGRDVGVLWHNNTLDDENGLLDFESRHCAAWVQFYFDEADIEIPGTIDNIYFHVWNYLEPSVLACDRHFGLSIDESYDVCTFFREWPLDSSLAWPQGSAHHQLVAFYAGDLHTVVGTIRKRLLRRRKFIQVASGDTMFFHEFFDFFEDFFWHKSPPYGIKKFTHYSSTESLSLLGLDSTIT